MVHLSRCFGIAAFLLTAPAWGDILYSNGAINGTIGGYDFTDAVISDPFVLSFDSTLTDVTNIGIWVGNGIAIDGLDWSISTGAGGIGTVEASSSSSTDFSATELMPTSAYGHGGFNVYDVSFTLDNLSLAAGTYYLTLSNGAAASGVLYWDAISPTGTIPYGNVCDAFGDCEPSENPYTNPFEVDGTAPEPAGVALLGAGLVALGVLKRRKKD